MNFIDEFKSEVVSFFIGVLFSFFVFIGRKAWGFLLHHKHINDFNKTSYILDEKLNIFTVENAIPEYKKINIVPSGKKLFVNIPIDYQDCLKEHSFYPNLSFDGTSSFRDLSIQTGIYDLEKLIEIHSKKIAECFVNGIDGCKFNEKKYGVFDIDIGMREGVNEAPVCSITTFETDFFTYRVFYSIYQELKQREHDICKIDNLTKLKKYNCFLCSIGLNVLACVDSNSFGLDELILTKRGNETINYQNMYHISVNEGMCYMDYNPSSYRFDVENCVFRGIEEELGISRDYHIKNNSDIQFWDLFVSKDTFDFGITCYIELKNIYFRDIQSLIAKDKKFEISKLETVLAKKSDIEKYVTARTFIPQGLYTVNSYFIRKFGRSIKIPNKKAD